MSSDEELMAAHVAGDRAAFPELVRRYGPILLRVMRQQLWAPEEANDLVQQTFLHVHRARNDFDPGQRFRPWVFTIALNLKREHLRRLRRRPEAPLDPDAKHPELAEAGGHGRTEAARALQRALPELPPDQAEVIALHWLGGLSFPEVGEVVGASTSAVKLRAHRGYKVLRELLRDTAPPTPRPAAGNQPSPAGIDPGSDQGR